MRTAAVCRALAAAWACMVGLPIAQAATPAAWKEPAPYAYRGGPAPLNRVLAEFARGYGATLVSQLPASVQTGGKAQGPTAEAFIDRLALDHQFTWFVYNNRLYVSPVSDRLTERIAIGSMSPSDVKQALVGIGLLEPKFGWGELQDDETVLVSGPAEYVRQVRAALGADSTADDGDAMLLRLRYAFLEDREIGFRDKTVRIPGLISILRNLAQDDRVGGSLSDGGGAGGAVPQRAARDGGAGGTAASARSAGDGSMAVVTGKSGGGKRDTPVTVEGDLRTNTVIIRGAGSRRSFYRNLVAQLDVPRQMVEIEAVIIDVERSKLTELGINWATTFGGGGGRTSVSIDNVSLARTSEPGTLLINNLSRFLAQVRALETEGYAAIAAKPVVMTMDNLSAVIDLSRTVYIRLIGERTSSALPVTAGTMLKVTPQIVVEGAAAQVFMRIDIEDGVLADANNASSPTVDRSTVATQLTVADQQSLIVASYNRQADERGRGSVPGLSSIPLLGRLFRGDSDRRATRERLFVITPRIVEAASAQARAAPAARRLDTPPRALVPLSVLNEKPVAPPPAADGPAPAANPAPANEAEAPTP